VLPTTRDVSREDWDARLQATLDQHGIDRIVLAGFMRILTDAFVARWAGRMVNIHPSLLPAFPGLHPHQKALDAGVCVTGCTVHLVEPGDVDGGLILAQATVPVHVEDDAVTLAARVLEAEHALYPDTIARWLSGAIVIDGGRVVRR
jgi:phosphoribosylglycinamide formyltransferase-1